MVAEANYSIPHLVEQSRPQPLVALRVRLGRLSAIKLDHQALPSAAKIRATRPHRMLAPEFKSGATPRPEFALNLRGLDSKSPASARPRSGLPEII
jgi:hypothetical protein